MIPKSASSPLGDQLFVPSRGQKWRGLPSSAPVKNLGMNKPAGGFWTSTYRGGRSDWSEWSAANLDRGAEEGVILSPGGRVYRLDDQADYDKLRAKFPREGMFGEELVDWEALSRAYDGVHLSRGGVRNLASMSGGNYDPPLESTLWFNPSVLEVKGTVKMGAAPSAVRVADRTAGQREAARVEYVGPEPFHEHDSSPAFKAVVQNPEYDPEEFYVIRGEKRWWEKPTKAIAYITLSKNGRDY